MEPRSPCSLTSGKVWVNKMIRFALVVTKGHRLDPSKPGTAEAEQEGRRIPLDA